jgi:hypothetical protein
VFRELRVSLGSLRRIISKLWQGYRWQSLTERAIKKAKGL